MLICKYVVKNVAQARHDGNVIPKRLNLGDAGLDRDGLPLAYFLVEKACHLDATLRPFYPPG